MNDETFHSKLITFIKENELDFISETDPEVIAKVIENAVFTYNEVKVMGDKKKDDYIKVIESELKDYQNRYGR